MIILSKNMVIKQIYVTQKETFIKNIKTEDAYKDIANDVEKESDTSNYETELD